MRLERSRTTLPAVLGLAVFVAALLALRRELGSIEYGQVMAAVFAIPASRLAAALALTVASYLALTGYDLLALSYVGRTLPRGRIVLASFLGYAISNSVGLGPLSGAAVRYRFYTRWGVTGAELSRMVVFYSTTLWLGLLLLGGACLTMAPLPGLGGPAVRHGARLAGEGLLLLAALYAALPLFRVRALRVGRLEVTVPGRRTALLQFALSSLDWTLAASVLHLLLPPSGLSFAGLLAAFLVAQMLGLASYVPGGLGVFESAMVALVRPDLTPDQVLPALVLYRVIYYLLPLAAALAVLALDELRQRRSQVERFRSVFGAVAVEVVPRLLAVFVFLAGAVLLLSGATPAAESRLEWLSRALPFPVLEASHFLGSVVGVGLLLLSQGLARRLDATWHLVAGALGVGIVASLLKGFDYEEASLLALVLAALLASRRRFDRRAAFFAARFSAGWIAAVLAVVLASVWLGLFAFRHVEYAHELWWRFTFEGEASRFLRASVGVAVALLAFGANRLLRPAPSELVLPGEDDLEAAGRVLAAQESTAGFLAYLRDKAVLFTPEHDAFLMYGVQGRTWAALGDPIGPADKAWVLVREFLERAHDFGADGVFYEVSKEGLHLYADFGLALVKLGEEARVSLTAFSLEGRANKHLRHAVRALETEGLRFRVAPADEVPALIGQLQEVSDEWLDTKQTGEKGFSVGFFDEAYLRRFPVALIERGGRVEAFANVWAGSGKVELSVDLMRFRASAPKGVMDALFVQLMRWGREQGYLWFGLGMAPLSGLEPSPVASLWARLGGLVYRHGEAFYNFQGLRAYKEKFDPVWEPRYLAYPGGLSLPRILGDLSALIAGGYGRIFQR